MLACQHVTGQDGDVKHVYVSGESSLDFIGTLKWRRDDREELLSEPADLDEWALGAGLVSSAPGADPEALDAARRLREAVYLAVTAKVGGGHPEIADLDELNSFAARPPVRPSVGADGMRRDGDSAAVLSSVARNAIEVLTDPALVLKECGRERCTRVFADRSRGARRSWCGMEECGNRVKAASYRERKRQGAAR